MPKELPKWGEEIPVEKFHVSPLNIRADEPFGETEEDRALIQQLWAGKKIVSAFKARPEGDGYGVYLGRRRFLAKRETGTKTFIVGFDVILEDVSDEVARRDSLIENLSILRKEMDPLLRAQKLNEIISHSSSGLRDAARELGISPSTLSEWLKILELSPKMQEAVKNGLISYTTALKLARTNISHVKQEFELAELLEKEGYNSFEKHVERLSKKALKRGLPRGKYAILRATFDKKQPDEMELFEKLKRLAKTKNMQVDEYAKWVLTEHVRKVQ
jgi:ParB family chromosome partitioning protein